MPTPYDGLYKQLFSHPLMIESLLRGFIHEEGLHGTSKKDKKIHNL
jgi:hypothetical protein